MARTFLKLVAAILILVGSFFATLQFMNWREQRNSVPVITVLGDDFNFGWFNPKPTGNPGDVLQVEVQMRTDTKGKFRIQVHDGLGTTSSPFHTGGGQWEVLRLSHKLPPDAKLLIVRIAAAEATGRPDRADIASARARWSNGAELPIDFAAFSNWKTGAPLPVLWTLEGGGNRARVERASP